MPKNITRFYFLILIPLVFSCKKNLTPNTPPPAPAFQLKILEVNNANSGFTYYAVNTLPVIKFSFSSPVGRNTVNENFSFKTITGATVSVATSYENDDSTVIVKPAAPLNYITQYKLSVGTGLKSNQGASLESASNVSLITSIDSTDKFPRISDSALLTLVQQQTFKYFWDFGHPISGMARERNSSGDICTTGGTGFGVMSILVGINRNFISRSDGLNRIQTIVDFLQNKCTRFH